MKREYIPWILLLVAAVFIYFREDHISSKERDYIIKITQAQDSLEMLQTRVDSLVKKVFDNRFIEKEQKKIDSTVAHLPTLKKKYATKDSVILYADADSNLQVLRTNLRLTDSLLSKAYRDPW